METCGNTHFAVSLGRCENYFLDPLLALRLPPKSYPFPMLQIFDRFKQYAASPGTGILLLNLGILVVFFYAPQPNTGLSWAARGLVFLSMLASAMYLVQKSDGGPSNLLPDDKLLFEDKGTTFLRGYQILLPVLILFLCGLILMTPFRRVLLQDWFIAGAMLLAILVQGKLLWSDVFRSPFRLRITEGLMSLNLKGHEEIYWDEVERIDWDLQGITFTLEEELEHHIGYQRMIADKAGFLATVQRVADHYQIPVNEEEEMVAE